MQWFDRRLQIPFVSSRLHHQLRNRDPKVRRLANLQHQRTTTFAGFVEMAVEGRPPTPKSILRGHKAQVHAVSFIRNNERLVTGDADGFLVAWDLTIMRPRAVWQAHENAILGIAGWGNDRIITHGRDNKLIVWQLTGDDERRMSTTLPLDPCTDPRPKPWILHLLEVNTMNFCSFAYCPVPVSVPPGQQEGQSQDTAEESKSGSELLIAVPNTLASEAVITSDRGTPFLYSEYSLTLAD